MITWTKFVLHSDVDAYKAAGWELGGDLRGTPHGHWSVIMKWAGEGDPIVPRASNPTGGADDKRA